MKKRRKVFLWSAVVVLVIGLMTETDTKETDSVGITETPPITVEDVEESIEESSDMKYGDNTSTYEYASLETQVASAEEDSDTVSKLIEDETYYFDDAIFVFNGIELTVHSITLHREYKPEGYSLEVAYSLQNQNDTDATFEFSSESGNGFILEEQKARMTKQATYSNEHCTEYHLKANEKTESLIGDFYAFSSSSGKTIGGESFEAVDISNLYAGQNITVNLQVNGICKDQTETMLLSFDIEL